MSLLTAISERLPRRQEKPLSRPAIDKESQEYYRELATDQYNQPFYLLADSIQALEIAAANARHAEVVEIVVADAHDLAARVLPPRLSDTLGVQAKHPDNIGLEHTHGSPTSLRALHLLLHAYDLTRDHTLQHVVTYIIQVAPPAFSEFHREAYEYAAETNRPIMPELRQLNAYADDTTDEDLALAIERLKAQGVHFNANE